MSKSRMEFIDKTSRVQSYPEAYFFSVPVLPNHSPANLVTQPFITAIVETKL